MSYSNDVCYCVSREGDAPAAALSPPRSRGAAAVGEWHAVQSARQLQLGCIAGVGAAGRRAYGLQLGLLKHPRIFYRCSTQTPAAILIPHSHLLTNHTPQFTNAPVEDEEEGGEVDESGVEPKDIELVMTQVCYCISQALLSALALKSFSRGIDRIHLPLLSIERQGLG